MTGMRALHLHKEQACQPAKILTKITRISCMSEHRAGCAGRRHRPAVTAVTPRNISRPRTVPATATPAGRSRRWHAAAALPSFAHMCEHANS